MSGEILFRSREILFRGERTDNGKWINDSETYIRDGDGIWLSDEDLHVVTVREDTLGRYTGMRDKNGKKIFEGDIVRHVKSKLFTVKWDGVFAKFILSELIKPKKATRPSDDLFMVNRYYEVIGNIFDNPELLEGGLK
jgi:hypothetical protein|nr:MAG TPA: YopX protein [Caudoviricetes sp.]